MIRRINARTTCFHTFFALAICSAMVVPTGCSDDDSAGNNNAVDAAVDAAEDGGTGVSMTFVVMTPTDATDVPVEGATVAFDAPGGVRTEQVTPADGRVTFDNIDWSLGQAAVTAHLLGYSLISIVNLDATSIDPGDLIDGAVPLLVFELEPEAPSMVTITGSATGLVDPGANNLYLFPFRVECEAWTGPATDAFEFKVEINSPFTLVGIEGVDGSLPSGRGYFVTLSRAMMLDHAAITDATAVLDLDFASLEATPLRATGTIVLPTRALSPLRDGWGNVWVFDRNSSAGSGTGWAEQLERRADGNAIDVSYIWLEPPLLEAPYTHYQVSNNLGGDRSYVFKPGYPQPGVLDPPILDVPHILIPRLASTVHPIHDPMEWEWFEADMPHTGLGIERNNVVVWYILAGPNSTSATIPQPPTGASTSSILGPNPRAFLFGGTWNPDYTWLQYVQSRPIRISP